MGKTIKIAVIIGAKKTEKEYPVGTTYGSIAEDFQDQYEYPIILARYHGKLMELNKKISRDMEISFLTTKDRSGHKTYMRGATLLMLRAFYGVCKGQPLKDVFIKYQIGNSCYCEVEGIPVTEALLKDVEECMRELVHRDIPFLKRSVDTAEALEIFDKHGMYDKKKLFEYRRVSKVNIYTLDGYEDYYYGYMPASTGVLQYFSLEPYESGFMLNLPNKNTPDQVTAHKPSPKLFSTLQEAKQWGKMVDVDTVGALNDVISSGGVSDLILVQEALQEKKIAQIAEQIVRDPSKKFIMIAGPSSSGKTSFSHRLSIQLRTLGLKPHPIALDNYFVNREETPLDENGNYNFECLEAIDVELFNKQMNQLLQGERVELPTFNFVTGQKEYKGDYRQLGEDDILVIEGIHGLNDKLSYTLPRESKFKIYISALTQINIDEHNRISTTDGRLIRRMVRDARTRGSSAARTIGMWPSVRRGEDQYIFPFQEEADVMFNSALIYELAVLKPYAEAILFGIPKDAPEYIEAKRLLKFLDYFIGISSEEIPKNSLMREFVGGSIFKV
ncbi:MAG: nucleoside kinase [Lachnospiraceae bacterium]|nr:nucleoside kinase [Lachnospiraceae bacterium]